MMASHGVPRLTEVEPRTQEKLEKELREIEDYRFLDNFVNKRIRTEDYSTDTLGHVTKLLRRNPEYYTVWNHRRRLLESLFCAKSDIIEVENKVTEELDFLIPLMVKFPKCYWIWNYRRWLLEQASQRLPTDYARSAWEAELGLVSKMLSHDGRNFHGWGYRRIVVTALEGDDLVVREKEQSLVQSEFDYTTKMIHKNLSNFSAWHNRSKLIPRLLAERRANTEECQAMLDGELNLIHEALIDPYDQSLWFYHAWLMTAIYQGQTSKSIACNLSQDQRIQYIEDEISIILDILEGFEDCKWIYQVLIQLAFEHKRQMGRWPKNGDSAKVKLWMQELKKLDPLRQGRWEDLERYFTF